ncbi:2-phospho-L-lactate guanylyltransferase [Longispora albida]|uniref:2-phospho-L-lactate guanylyltransferase n=1 Tax=Longispora albida TaxID=203523 RepID=UPI000369BC71|nr:2-phospho-L-lactate guanylyltransferase [Longispora albida]
MSRWSVIIPVKPAALGKSRLRGGVPGHAHEDLARAFALDTISAALACPVVGAVVVVTDDPVLRTATDGGVRIVGDPPAGDSLHPVRDLNHSVRHGELTLHGPRAALTADLPALGPADLAAALTAAARHPRSFVADAAGTGTVLLASAGPLQPLFGAGSAGAHAGSGAVPLPGTWASLRQDVDTPADLAAAIRLGVGRHTAAVLAGL